MSGKEENAGRQGKLLIFSAPSGAGKTTLVRHVLDSLPEVKFSVSATSRPPRPGEKDGRDYYFLSPGEFERKIKEGAFLEWEEVYKGTYYGTLREEVERIWKGGGHVIFDIDVVGGLRLKELFPRRALAVFVAVPSEEDLERRLRGRKTESEEKIQERLQKAREEYRRRHEFDRVLVNGELERAKAEALQMVRDFIAETHRAES